MVCDCGKQEVFGIGKCGNCLVRVVEKRAKKALSSHPVRNASIVIVNDGSCAGQVNAYLVNTLVTKAKSIRQVKEPPKGDVMVFLPNTADMEAEELLEFMFKSRSRSKSVKLVKDSLESELIVYAKIKGIKHRSRKKKSDTAVMLDEIEKSFKGSKYSLARAAEKLNK